MHPPWDTELRFLLISIPKIPFHWSGNIIHTVWQHLVRAISSKKNTIGIPVTLDPDPCSVHRISLWTSISYLWILNQNTSVWTAMSSWWCLTWIHFPDYWYWPFVRGIHWFLSKYLSLSSTIFQTIQLLTSSPCTNSHNPYQLFTC